MAERKEGENSEGRPAPMAVRREGPSDGLIGSDVDIQVATAKKYPRSIGQAKERAMELATLDRETAESCSYALKRAGKIIEGPSARLAEIVAASWGNLRVAAKTTGSDEGFIYAESVCWDLESNVAISYETRRRITKSDGQMFSEDMIGVTGNAAVSIAFRNSVFRVLSRAFVNEVWRAAKKVAAGEIKDLKQRRFEMLGYFESQGVSEDQILVLLGISDVDDVTLEMLSTLRGFATAIKDGLTSVEAIFSRHDEQDVEQLQTEKPQAESTKSESSKNASETDDSQASQGEGHPDPGELDNQKARLIDEIRNELGQLYPGDAPERQAARLKALKHVFGQTVVDEIAKLPSQVLKTGLEYLKNKAAGAEAVTDEIPF